MSALGVPQKFVERHVIRADPYAFKVAHRRLAWLCRLSVGTSIALGAAVLALSAALIEVMPLKEVRVALLRADPADDRIYRVEPIGRDVPGFELLLESMARRYVSLMLTIDPVSQGVRLSEAARMTGREFFERFKETRIDSGDLSQAIADGLNRSIIVESSNKLASRGEIHTYTVDVVQVDKRDGAEIGRKELRVYLSMTTRPFEVNEAQKYENPLGVVVVDMAVKDRSV